MTDQQPIYVNNDLFLGRTEEQKEFRRILPEVIAPPRGEELPYVVLLYGGGGMGKTTLARRFHNIATMESPCESVCQTLWIDWEEERNKHAPLQVGREHIRAAVLFERIHAAVVREGWGKHFKAYQKMHDNRGKAEQAAAKALAGSGEQDELGRKLAGITTSGLAKVIRMATPMGETGEGIAQGFMEAGVHVAAKGAFQLRSAAETRLKAELDNDQYQLFLNPEEQMSLALAEGLESVAKKKPLLMFFDTYEIIDHADIWVREVIKAAGAKVLWVIAGRQDLAQSRQFGNEYFRGYRETFPRRLLAYNVPQLAQDDLRAFFADVAPDRLLTDEQAATISQATRGIPLAIKTAAEVWQRGVSVEELVGNLTAATPHSDIVSHMTARYLLHVVNDEEDRLSLYALALARGDDDVLKAMIRPAGETVAFDLPARLATLSRRYAAVQLSETRLHDEPTAFLTAYLRDPIRRNSDPIKQMNERAAAALKTRLAKLDDEMVLLEERAEDEEWVQMVLALTRTLFWLDEQRAWQWLIPRYVEGMAYSRDLRRGLLNVAASWRDDLSRRGKKRLKTLQATSELTFLMDAEAEDKMLTMVEKLARAGWLSGEGEAERRAILNWRWGKLRYRQKAYSETLVLYEKAMQGLPDDGEEWKSKLADDLYSLSNAFIWPDDAPFSPTQEGLRASQMAIILDETNGSATYNYAVALNGTGDKEEAIIVYQKALAIEEKATRYTGLGNVYDDLGRFEEAISAYKQAIALNPTLAHPHNGLGNVYQQNGRFEKAISAFKQAITLDPKDAYPHNGLGIVYQQNGRFEEAISAFKQAITLDPKDAYPHNGLGNVYKQNGRFDEAIAAYKQAIELDPKVSGYHSNLGDVYQQNGRFEEAISAYKQAITLDPKDAESQASLASLYRKLGQTAVYNKQIEITRPLIANSNAYNRACFASICDEVDEAVELLKEAIAIAPADRQLAQNDPDFEFIRDDPRFQAVVGGA